MKRWTCLLCGRERGAREETAADLLLRGSWELEQRFGVPVRLTVYGGMHRLTAQEAREMLREAEAELEAEARAAGGMAAG